MSVNDQEKNRPSENIAYILMLTNSCRLFYRGSYGPSVDIYHFDMRDFGPFSNNLHFPFVLFLYVLHSSTCLNVIHMQQGNKICTLVLVYRTTACIPVHSVYLLYLFLQLVRNTNFWGPFLVAINCVSYKHFTL